MLVVIRSLTPDWLEELAGALHLTELEIGVVPAVPARGLALDGPPTARTVQVVKDPDGRTGLLLTGPDGTTTVGQTVWRPHRPGTQYLLALLPSLGIALLLFVAFGWSALRQSRSSTSAIVESETRFRDVADASSDWIFETDAEGRLTWISDRFIALTGIPVGEIEGRPLVDLLLPMSGDEQSLELDRALQEQRLFRDLPALLPRPRGPAARPARLRQADPRRRRPACRLARHGDRRHRRDRGPQGGRVPQRARRADRLPEPLRACSRALGEVLDAARRRSQLAAFLMLDIDGFKEVNDIYGPIVGDQLIHAVAASAGGAGAAGRRRGPARVPTSSCWSGRRWRMRRRRKALAR